MGKRGPKSASELSTAQIGLISEARMHPPDHLSERAKIEWKNAIHRLPRDWFSGENLSILAIHCTTVAEVEELTAMIEKVRPTAMVEDESHQRYSELLRLRDQAVKSALATCRSLRLVPQSRIDPKVAGAAARNHAPGARPWKDSTLSDKEVEKQNRIDSYFDD